MKATIFAIFDCCDSARWVPLADGESDTESMLVYKIVGMPAWRAAEAAGVYLGSADDARDGFIHLSTADQVAETLARHFAGDADLALVAFDEAALDGTLRYEPSRGGALFPHLYGMLDPALALWVRPIPLKADGSHALPDLK